MANHVDTLRAGGPAAPARPLLSVADRLGRRVLVDRVARRLVTLGGVAIIATILAILVVIVVEVYPLFTPPTSISAGAISPFSPVAPLGLGVDEYRQIAYLVTPGGIQFVALKDGATIPIPPLAGLGDAKITATSPLGRGPFALGLSDGRAIPAEVKFNVSFPEGKRKIEPEVTAGDPLKADAEGRPLRHVAYTVAKGGPIAAAAVGPRELVLVTVKETKALIGPSTKEASSRTVSLPVEGEITALALDGRGEDLFVGATSGQVITVDLREPSEPKVAGAVQSGTGKAVTALEFLIGDRTLIVGDAGGGVTSWQLLRADGGDRRLTKIYTFPSHPGPVVAVTPSSRDKGFATGDASGNIRLNYGTTGESLLTLKAEGQELRELAFAPKADGLLAAAKDGRLLDWTVVNPHPEITLKSLFGKIWYEGYDRPEYVWQSTGGTDDFEAKFSLTPLIYGSLKGTFYALLFALPLALLGALYVSQFMHPTLKAYVKPTVEIMAALPSVVLGFIAGLWLAPMVEKVVPGLFLMPSVITILILLAVGVWQFAPLSFRKRFKAGTEVFLLIPVALLGGWLAFSLGGILEQATLGGDYRAWLLSSLGLTYDQRNSLVVGFAMGFAVIPIIFTIAEDALSSVPQHLTAGSLALGATRWQTALRVVLPTASPGIFSAIMIGFGRAVGETMIVLMATGNTPVMDWSIFNGFRALSANIAVELPEAPEAGTLFRVLFLAALLLFILTFIVNTVAEVVRLHLRRKYRYL